MAKIISRSTLRYKLFQVLGLFSLLMLIQKGGAYQFKVGGSNGWTVPTDPSALSYNQWAEKNRFQIGDTLLFVYPGDKDSVLQVTKDDYSNCNTATPLAKYSDGYTVFKFNQSGPFYFISGVKDNCLKNEKLVVVVMADRSSTSNQTTVASPPPSGSSVMTPSPSPAPVSKEPPSPAPGPVAMIPSLAPASDQQPHPSGASSIVMSSIGSIGAFLGSSVLLVF